MNNYDIDDMLGLPCPVFLKDAQGRVIDCNEPQALIIGRTRDEFLGEVDVTAIPEKERAAIINNDMEIIKYERPKIFFENVTLNGKLTHILTYKMPIKNGNKIKIFGLAIPLTSNDFITMLLPLLEKTPLLQNQMQCLVNNGNPYQTGYKKLSPRETECLYYLSQGMTSKKIARLLFLSPRTIEFYIHNIKNKFGCTNRTELIAKAFDVINKQ